MLKTKFLLPLFVIVLFLGLANSAFAQVSCSIASTPVSRATETGLTEPAGDIIFNCVLGTAATTAATITVDYTTPITNSTTYPAGKPIAVVNNTCVAITVSSVSNSTGQVVLSVAAFPAAAGVTCSFTLTGILQALSGAGKTSVQAQVSVSPGNNLLITAGQNVATVITAVLAGIKTPTATTPALFLTTGVPIGTGTFTITVAENYIDSYRATAQFNTGAATQGVQLSFAFTGLATGVSLTGCSTAATGTGATVVPFIVGGGTTVAAATPTLVVEAGGTANLAGVENITLTCTGMTVGSTATVPLAAGNITATVTLAPTGAAFGAGGTVLTSATAGQIPRYTSTVLGPVTVATIISPTTHMLFPYVSIGNGFDTGFVVTNTTADPYGFTTGAVNTTGGARAITGPVTLAFYPTGGTAFCVSTGAGAATVAGVASCTTLNTTATPSVSGLGLGTGGVVASGSSWVALGSELLKQVTGAPAVFNGYVFGIANFPFSHPSSFVADAAFSGKFTAGGPALVLPPPNVVARTAFVAEALGH